MIWRSVPGWEEFYEVSDEGRVRSRDRVIYVLNPFGRKGARRFKGRELRASVSKNGYPFVSFTAPGRARRYAYIHDLVLQAFVGPKPPGKEVCHGDGSRQNNALTNLRYDTRSNNALDRHAHGTFACLPRGEAHRCAKLTDDAVRAIRRSGRSFNSLAEVFGVSNTAVAAAAKRKSWRHVT